MFEAVRILTAGAEGEGRFQGVLRMMHSGISTGREQRVLQLKGDALHLPEMCQVWHLSLRQRSKQILVCVWGGGEGNCYSSKIKSLSGRNVNPCQR